MKVEDRNPARNESRRAVRWVLGISIVTMLAYVIALAVIESGDIARALRQASGTSIGVAALLSLVNYAIRFARWQWYLAVLGHAPRTGTSLLVYLAGFGFTVTPGKAGEMWRSVHLAREGVPLSRSLAAFVVERLLDVAAVAVLVAVTLGAGSGYGWLVAVTAGVVGIAIATVSGGFAGRLAIRLASMTRGRLRDLLASISRTAESAERLLRPWPLLGGLALGVAAWGAEGLGLWVLLQSFGGASPGIPESVAVYSAAILAGAVTFLPGGLGGTEVAMVLLLGRLGVPAEVSVVVTVICRVVTLWLAVVLGWVALGVLARRTGGFAALGQESFTAAPNRRAGESQAVPDSSSADKEQRE